MRALDASEAERERLQGWVDTGNEQQKRWRERAETAEAKVLELYDRLGETPA